MYNAPAITASYFLAKCIHTRLHKVHTVCIAPIFSRHTRCALHSFSHVCRYIVMLINTSSNSFSCHKLSHTMLSHSHGGPSSQSSSSNPRRSRTGSEPHAPLIQLPGQRDLETFLLRETRPQVQHIDTVLGGQCAGQTSSGAGVPAVSWSRILAHMTKFTSRVLHESSAFCQRVHSDDSHGHGLVAMDNTALLRWVKREYRSSPVTEFYSAFVQTQQYSQHVSQALALS
jgi:hypothetical protein